MLSCSNQSAKGFPASSYNKSESRDQFLTKRTLLDGKCSGPMSMADLSWPNMVRISVRWSIFGLHMANAAPGKWEVFQQTSIKEVYWIISIWSTQVSNRTPRLIACSKTPLGGVHANVPGGVSNNETAGEILPRCSIRWWNNLLDVPVYTRDLPIYTRDLPVYTQLWW